MKKAICFLLVILLLFPGGVLAAEEAVETPAAEEDEVTVQMRVPSSGQVLVNPYGYTIDTSYGKTDEQIISSTQYLVSRSSVPISVSVEVEGTHSDPDAEFVTGEPDPAAKELFLYAEFQPVADGEDPVWIGSYTGADCQVLINQSKADAVTIPAGDDTPGTVAFRLFGAVSARPEKGWTSNDSLSVIMSYKFVPLEEPETSETPEEEAPEAEPEEETPEDPGESEAVTEEPEQETAQEPEKPDEVEAEKTENPAEQTPPVETPAAEEEEEPPRDENTDRPSSFRRDESETTSSRDDEEDYNGEESGGISWLSQSRVTEVSVRDEPREEQKPAASDSSDSSGISWLEQSDEAERDEPARDTEPETGEETPVSDDSGGISWLTQD